MPATMYLRRLVKADVACQFVFDEEIDAIFSLPAAVVLQRGFV